MKFVYINFVREEDLSHRTRDTPLNTVVYKITVALLSSATTRESDSDALSISFFRHFPGAYILFSRNVLTGFLLGSNTRMRDPPTETCGPYRTRPPHFPRRNKRKSIVILAGSRKHFNGEKNLPVKGFYNTGARAHTDGNYKGYAIFLQQKRRKIFETAENIFL